MKTKNKQPWEVLPVGIDFSAELEDGEAIVLNSSLVIAYSATQVGGRIVIGAEAAGFVVAGSTATDGEILQAVITGGVDGALIVLSFRAYISATKKLEDDLLIIIKD